MFASANIPTHGHCGQLCGHEVDNDATLKLLAKVAVSQAKSGADIIAPSDMMDGRIAVLREALDEAGFQNVAIMSYTIKIRFWLLWTIQRCCRFCSTIR